MKLTLSILSHLSSLIKASLIIQTPQSASSPPRAVVFLLRFKFAVDSLKVTPTFPQVKLTHSLVVAQAK